MGPEEYCFHLASYNNCSNRTPTPPLIQGYMEQLQYSSSSRSCSATKKQVNNQTRDPLNMTLTQQNVNN